MAKRPTVKKIKNVKQPAEPKAVVLPKEIQNEANHMLRNGLSEAIMGFTPGGMGTQLSQVDTLFKNNRWYLVSNMRQLLSEIYVEHGLIQTVVDVPVDDGLRGGVEVKSKQLSPEQIEEVQITLERKDLISGVMGQALKWNRLFGGAGILIMTDQDPMLPLDVNSITEDAPLEFRAVDMWELYWDKQNVEGYDASIEEHEFEHYSYYGTKVHKSRVMRLKGLTAPSFIRPRLRGWGFSILESLVRSLNQWLKANDLTFEVLDEFKIDVYKIDGLSSSLLSGDGNERVAKRVQLANWQKNYQHAITMDAKDDYSQKELSFTGLAETMEQLRMQIASDLRMPITKLFGTSMSGGLGNTDQNDMENYNAMVESQVRAKAKFDILRMVELVCQQKYGFIPDDLMINYKPLRILSAEQEEIVKTAKFNRVLGAVTANKIDDKEFRDMCNKDELLPISLDTDKIILDLDGDASDEGVDPDEEAEGDKKTEPGANKPMSENPIVPGSEKKKLNAIPPRFKFKR